MKTLTISKNNVLVKIANRYPIYTDKIDDICRLIRRAIWSIVLTSFIPMATFGLIAIVWNIFAGELVFSGALFLLPHLLGIVVFMLLGLLSIFSCLDWLDSKGVFKHFYWTSKMHTVKPSSTLYRYASSHVGSIKTIAGIVAGCIVTTIFSVMIGAFIFYTGLLIFLLTVANIIPFLPELIVAFIPLVLMFWMGAVLFGIGYATSVVVSSVFTKKDDNDDPVLRVWVKSKKNKYCSYLNIKD